MQRPWRSVPQSLRPVEVLPNARPSSNFGSLTLHMPSQSRSRSSNTQLVPLAGMVLIGSALLFGGATRLDVLAPMVPRLVAVAVIALLVWQGRLGWSSWGRGERLIWGVLFAVPLIQLVPLPFAVWTSLPGREYARDISSMLGMNQWLQISLTRDATINSLLALLPAFAIYALARQANEKQVRGWLFMILLIAIVGAMLSLLQMASGTGSSLRFYAITNNDSAVGFFSNANHHASFLAVTLLILCYWLLESLAEARKGTEPFVFTSFLIALAAIILAILFTFSRAGLLFLAAILLVCAVLAAIQFQLSRTRILQLATGLVLVIAGGLYLFLSDPAVAERMAIDIRDNGRIGLLPVFGQIIADQFPFGSGLGSFDPIYRKYEVPSALDYNYLNHAHNDYAQLMIEAGLPAIVGLLLFFLWWARAARVALRGPARSERARVQGWVAAGGTAILLLHSAADYPLRGAAVSVVFALLCAILARGKAAAGNSRFE